MPRTKTGKGAGGAGSIRKITTTRNGKTYTYWQGRYTESFDPGTGKQIQRSITGKTQKEVAQKLRRITASLDDGTYKAPCKLTVGEWLDIWTQDYLVSVKPRTVDSYKTTVENHLKPAFAAMKLDALKTQDVQRFYNSLQVECGDRKPLSAKSVRNIHGVFHKAMQQAVKLGHIRTNPADPCDLPRAVRKDIHPLDNEAIARFLKVARGHRYEAIYVLTLFTGLREGEVLGLLWDCVDLERSVIVVNKQLQKERRGNGESHLVTTTNGKSRQITAAPFVVDLLKKQRRLQESQKRLAGEAWENSGLVFTNEMGHHLSAQTVYLHFKKLAGQAGFPSARFHDLRHSYAVASLQSGDDIKTVQENLGHQTAAFTLDVYAHATNSMKRESANRMDQYIHSVTKT